MVIPEAKTQTPAQRTREACQSSARRLTATSNGVCRSGPSWVLCLLWLVATACLSCTGMAQGTGTVEIDFVEQATDEPLACRVKILDPRGRPVRARGTLFQDGWNLVEKTLLFKGRPADYTYQVFHGPQFSAGQGGFTLDKNASGYDVLALERHADLDSEGWIGGDLLSYGSAEQTRRWLPAEDLRMAVSVRDGPAADLETTGEGPERWVEGTSYHDNRPGSGLVLHHWLPPADVPETLASTRLLVMAKHEAEAPEPVHAEIQRLWARDVPIWLASKHIDSVQVLSEHLTLDGRARSWKPIVDPDPGRFRGALGPGQLVEYLYWQLLETGLRIAPTAGSGFGESGSPLGYNRVYASVSSPTSRTWWQAVRAGRSFVTNGPLLRTEINGAKPGTVFSAPAGGSVELDVSLTLTTSDPVQYLEVVFNGQSLYQARLDEYARQGGQIPVLEIEESGWLIVRVVTERAHTYRLAMTAPYYFDVGAPRVSETAVRFFQRWLEASAEQIATSPQAASSQPYVDAARRFWQARLEMATVP